MMPSIREPADEIHGPEEEVGRHARPRTQPARTFRQRVEDSFDDAVLGLGILYGNWSMNRTIQQSRAELPDRIELPRDAGDAND